MCLVKIIKVTNDQAKAFKKLTKEEKDKYALNLFKIAKKDIPVKKTIFKRDKHYLSYFRYFRYEKKTHYFQTGQKFTFGFNIHYIIGEGWHIVINVHVGLHSHPENKKKSNNYSSLISCIIPKGSLYLKSTGGYAIVSDNLIIP